MLELLVIRLREYGLELNTKKTKMMSSTVQDEDTSLVDTNLGFLELVGNSSTHKYLGRNWPGNFIFRGETAVSHRLGCAWARFNGLRNILTNKLISLRSRLRLFASTITPTVAYSLETAPLTMKLEKRLDVMQRKMLRSIVGWRIDESLTYEQNGHIMKQRVATALKIFPIAPGLRQLRRQSRSYRRRWTLCGSCWKERTTTTKLN